VFRNSRNILFVLFVSTLFTFCKKDANAPESPPPTTNAAPCNANNLVVDSIKETNGEVKIYKLTIRNYTLSSPSGTNSAITAVHQVTFNVTGDTLVNNQNGKLYNIKSTNGWDFRAFSYLSFSDSLWRLVPLTNSNGGQDFFIAAIKLPLATSQSYSYILSTITHSCSVGGPACISINNIQQPAFSVGDFVSSFPELYISTFYVDKTGFRAWSYFVYHLQTQNPENYGEEWYFERTN
jgi:hypothetical protein